MLRCAILDDYQGVATRFGDFSSLGDRVSVDVFRAHINQTEALVAALAPYDIIIAMRERTPFDAARLAALPRLKLLVTTGMRNASIDMAAASRAGIMVCGTPGFAGSTAELAFGLMLALARNITAENRNFQANGPWQLSVGRDLKGLTLGVLGLGTLGAKIATLARAFDMNVLGWSRNNSPERSEKLGVSYVPSLESVLSQADVVSIHLTLTPETRGLINAERLALMKPDAFIINTSRGPIIEEAALVAALRAGRLAGAGLDVFDQEPLPADHPFRTLPNVVATPHLGYVTENSYRAFFTGAVAAIERWLASTPVNVLAKP